jgi:general secretion pathway protein I
MKTNVGQVSNLSRTSRQVGNLSYHRGFTLLEVMLALAILVGAIAVLGEFGRVGLRCAKSSRDLTRAELLCESVMSEITAGILTPDSAQGVPVTDPSSQGTSVNTTQADDGGSWVYSIDAKTIDQDGLIAVTVTVQNTPVADRPASFSLTRWIPDPGLESSDDSSESDSSDSQSTSSETQSSTGATK